MKLSEAIRLGAMLKPQAFFGFGKPSKSCALQAAADAVGGHQNMTLERWTCLRLPEVRCPACEVVWRSGAACNAGGAVIVHLNDEHRWTRERIADWVETLEPAEPVTVDQPAATVTA